MKLSFLGTGTSQGIPVIGCQCEVCASTDPRDHRLRTSVLLSDDQLNIAIDCGPDFRQQMLRSKVGHLDALLLTHEHNDHVIGMDDVRPFNFRSGKNMPVYATTAVQQKIKTRFAYIFDVNPYPGSPRLEFHTIDREKPFYIQHLKVQPIEVWHGRLSVLGFRFGDFAYITDAKTIELKELNKLKGINTLVLNALHHRVHHSHLNLAEALEWISRIRPQRAYLLHISHRMGRHQTVSSQLPESVFLAYDGLELEVA